MASSSSMSRSWLYHVFLSFCGQDVRKGFLSHVLKEFKSKGIETFIDNEIRRGQSVGPELVLAIRQSRVALVLLSCNYASSSWCLDELVEIMKCREKYQQTVMTIFYEVDPSNVRKQTGDFGKAFEKTCVGKTEEVKQAWRQALTDVASIAGYHSSNWGNEAGLINKLASDVSAVLGFTPSKDFDDFVGIEAHITEIKSKLILQTEQVKVIGIVGPVGIGKTTAARVLYNQLSHGFSFRTFLENIGGRFESSCGNDHELKLRFQEMLLSQLFNQNDIVVRLSDKKVLVVLDEVDSWWQLEEMAKRAWFGPGSMIIITTEDSNLLKALRLEANQIYEMKLPTRDEALQILCIYAFGQKFPNYGFESLARVVTELAGNLPLGLRVMGSYLRGMSKNEWIDALPRLKSSLDREIESTLKLSYDVSSDKDKALLLHIACFFADFKVDSVRRCLEKSDLSVNYGLQTLAERSLISMEDGYVRMHSLLQQMGKEIVYRQSAKPGKRQFLTTTTEIFDFFDENTVSGTVLGIKLLKLEGEEIQISKSAFQGIRNLQFLDIDGGTLSTPEGLNCFPQKLRYIRWKQCPMRFWPSEFSGEFLVELIMPNNNFEILWEGIKPLPCLRRMDLNNSQNLYEIPDLSHATRLEELNLSSCDRLSVLPFSVGRLINLEELNLSYCGSLEKLSGGSSLEKISGCSNLKQLDLSYSGIGALELPSSFSTLSSLYRLDLSGLRDLKKFPNVPDSIVVLLLHNTGIVEIPPWIENLFRLQELIMWDCKNLKIVSGNISKLENLQTIDLFKGSGGELNGYFEAEMWGPDLKRSWKLRSDLNIHYILPICLPEKALTSPISLRFFSKSVKTIPDCIRRLSGLCELTITDCIMLTALPQLPGSCLSLDAHFCRSLKRIDSSFQDQNPNICLNFSGCYNLNQKARKLIQTSACKYAFLPGEEVPAHFTHRASSDSLTINLTPRPLPSSFRFKACILLSEDNSSNLYGPWTVSCRVRGKKDGHTVPYGSNQLHHVPDQVPYRSHLYIFEDSFSLNHDYPETEDPTFSELSFLFIVDDEKAWKVKGCGVRLLEVLDGKETEYQEYIDTNIEESNENAVDEDDEEDEVGDDSESTLDDDDDFEEDDVAEQLKGCGYFPRVGIDILVDKSTIPRHGNLTGHQPSDSEFVKDNVRVVLGKLSPTERNETYSRLPEIVNLLSQQPWDVLSLGIWGMPGIGKTRLAKEVFHQIHSDYDASCFIDDFDAGLSEGKPQSLLKTNILNIVIEKLGVSSTYTTRLGLLKDKLRDTKILLVLDDVRNPLVAESFLRRLDWFGRRSLIIVTSRYKQVFALCQVNDIYKVQGLNEQEALQLFSETAFGKEVPEQDDLELSKKVIHYANGNPLALRIYGQELMKGKKSEMEAKFLILKQRPPQMIQDMLKGVYSTLSDNEKQIFLSIACFFKGENVDYVAELLKGCGYFPRVGIDILVDKCMLAISENTLQMNDLIQDIFRHIVTGDRIQMKKCTTLWQPSSIRCLLEEDELKGDDQLKETPKSVMVTKDIQGISLDTSNLMFSVNPDAFKNMTSLRFLKIYSSHSENVHGLKVPKGLNFLPSKLRLLHWENYSFESLREDFNLTELVELNMPYSRLKELRARTEKLEKLKRVGLRHSQQLVEFSIHENAQNIEMIDLQGCTRLESFPAMTKLQHLQVLNLSGCSNVKTLPGLPPNIEELYLQGTSIEELPKSFVAGGSQPNFEELMNHMRSFRGFEHIDMESVTLKASSYNQSFGKLVRLNMKGCVHLRSLLDMCDFESLQFLNLSGCSSLQEIKGFPRSIKEIYLGGTSIRELPELPESLEVLNAHDCGHLKTVRLDFKQLPRHYTFSNCFSLSSETAAEFLEKGVTRVIRLAKEENQEHINKARANMCFPADKRYSTFFQWREGSCVSVELTPRTQKTLLGFAMSVLVSFPEKSYDLADLGIMCTCTWGTKKGHFCKLEKVFKCWAPGVKNDHIFVFYDSEMHPGAGEQTDSDEEFKFEFHTVSGENKPIGDTCMVKGCGVQVITAPASDKLDSGRESETISIFEEDTQPEEKITSVNKEETLSFAREPEIQKDVASQDLHSLLSSPARDFLIRNDGQQVKIDSLKGKKIGLYFAAAWCGPCQRFTPELVEIYNELYSKVGFEVIFVSGDEDEESFKDYFSKMPWLAVPFTDSETRDRLEEVFKVRGIPNLVMIDDQGKLVIENGVGVIRSYGADSYPFTPEKMKEIKEEEERARREQTLKSVLVTPSRDFVVSRDGTKVPVSELEGKTIGLLFSVGSYRHCAEFTSKLLEVYKKLKENNEDFEIVLISLEDDEEAFKQDFENHPWLALPFNNKSSSKLTRHFMLSTLPTLVILGPDGKTLHSNVAEAVDDYGVLAYPFTPEKFEELKEIEKAKLEAQTLESLLVSGDLNYVLGKDGAKVLVSDLVGKNILLYFSAHWCPPCRAFTPKLVEVYKQIKEKDEAFELIFLSSDRDQESFEECYSQMPWLALPFGDPRKASLARTFKVGGIPMLAALGPTGKTVTAEARDLVGDHGADAYPFTEERIKEIEAKYNEMAKEWPAKVGHALHKVHELELTRVPVYICDKCDEEGQIWSYHCDKCDFDLHAKCL